MSFDLHYRFPGPWDPASLRTALDAAARELGATRFEVSQRDRGRSLHVVAWWTAESVRRWRVADEDGTTDHGEFRIDWNDDEPGPWQVSACASTVDDEPLEIVGLAVAEPELVTLGIRAVSCVGGGTIARVHEKGHVEEYRSDDDRLAGLALGGADAWAVGANARVLHRSAGKWTAVATPARGDLRAVALVGGEAWIAGEAGAWRRRGAAWEKLAVERADVIGCGPDGTPWIDGARLVGDRWQGGPPRFVEWQAWTGGDAPWLFGVDTAWQPDRGGWIEHELGLADDITFACTIAGVPWLGTSGGGVMRWNGRDVEPIDVGAVGRVTAMVPYAGGALIAVASGWDGVPALLFVLPAAHGSVHVTSGRGGTAETWGVTCELASRVVRRLGGIVESF